MGLSREPNSELGLQNDLEQRFLTSVPQELSKHAIYGFQNVQYMTI